MGKRQSEFISEFKYSFEKAFGEGLDWRSGQKYPNYAGFSRPSLDVRRGQLKRGEGFELGDISTSIFGVRIIVEFETGAVSASNILKFWPYLRGDLDSRPLEPILFCHFSNWWSYAAWRDLWGWTMNAIKADPTRLVSIDGAQFDHGGEYQGIDDAITWLRARLPPS